MNRKNIDYILKKGTTGDILPLLDTEYRRFNEIRISYKNVCERIGKVPHDSLLARILNDLKEAGIVEKKEVKKERGIPQTFYRISPKFKELIWPMITKFTDKLLMDIYPNDQIISQSKTTFYGLKNGVFVPPLKPENLEFQYFTPEYIKLSKNGLTVNDLFEIKEGLFKGKRKEKIGISEALEKITDKLLELKKEHRLKELKISFEKRLKEIKEEKIKRFLKKYSDFLLYLINSTDQDEENLTKCLSIPGSRKIDFAHTKLKPEDITRIREILPKKEKNWTTDKLSKKYKDGILVFNYQGLELWGKNYFYPKYLNKLTEKEKSKVINFLLAIIKDTNHLYPTNIVVVCKTFRGIIKDEYKVDIMKYL